MPGAEISPQGSGIFLMDYLNIGSNGFAQVGDPDYYRKCRTELRYLLRVLRDRFPMPEELTGFTCYFKVKSFPHDFGTYHEIVLYYDDVQVEAWESSEDETVSEQADLFWGWFYTIEAFDLESDEITEAIKASYLLQINLEKGEHLSVERA